MSGSGVSAGNQLRELMKNGPVYAAGAFDALSAHLIEYVGGFGAVYISGLAAEASLLASPDIGMMTRAEMLSHALRIARAVELPIICDVDTGYGDALHVGETVRQFERAGIAAIHIEDQSEPKKCPTYETPTVLPVEQAEARLLAALAARTDSSFMIIGRTDAYGISFSEVVDRANRYLALGVDAAMCPLLGVNGQAMSSLPPSQQYEWLCRFANEVDGPVFGLIIPAGYTMYDMVEGGYHSMILPTLGFQAATTAVLTCLEAARGDGTAYEYFEKHPRDPRAFGLGLSQLLGLDDHIRAREVQH